MTQHSTRLKVAITGSAMVVENVDIKKPTAGTRQAETETKADKNISHESSTSVVLQLIRKLNAARKREREREDLWRKMQDLSIRNATKEGISLGNVWIYFFTHGCGEGGSASACCREGDIFESRS